MSAGESESMDRAAEPPLSRLYLVLTDRCNMQCVHCYRPKETTGTELSTPEVRRLLDHVSAEGLCRQVTFTGGEPLLREDLWQIVAVANEAGMVVDLSTNGYHLKDRDFAELAEGRVQYLQVSVDGATRETFDKMRGAGTYDKVQANLDRMARLRLHEYIDMSMVACVTPVNYLEIEGLAAMASKYLFNKLAFGEVMPIGRGGRNYGSLALAPEQLAEVYRQINELRARPVGNTRVLAQFYFGWQYDEKYRPNVCTLETGDVATVGPTGDVYLCPYFYEREFIIGNVRHSPLKAILGDGRVEQIRREYSAAKVECQSWDLCGGGCRVLGRRSGKRPCDPRCPK